MAEMEVDEVHPLSIKIPFYQNNQCFTSYFLVYGYSDTVAVVGYENHKDCPCHKLTYCLSLVFQWEAAIWSCVEWTMQWSIFMALAKWKPGINFGATDIYVIGQNRSVLNTKCLSHTVSRCIIICILQSTWNELQSK